MHPSTLTSNANYLYGHKHFKHVKHANANETESFFPLRISAIFWRILNTMKAFLSAKFFSL